MEFEKSITTEELVKIHDEIRVKFTKSNERVDNAKELSEAALKTAEDTVKEIVDLISVLNKERQVEIAIKMRKMVASMSLSVAAEIIVEKQEHEQKKYNSILNTANGNRSFGPSAGKSYQNFHNSK